MHDKPRQIRFLLLAAILAVLPTCPAAADKAAPKLLRECPGGRLYQFGSQRLLMLAGEPYQMGLAHGKLLKNQIKTMTNSVLMLARATDAVKKKDFFAGTIEQAYKRLEPFIPQRYQQEMRGLADGAGLPLKDVQLANIFPALFHCSGFALFGQATQGGQLLHGRILDYITQIGLQNHAVTIIARPKGYNTFVNVSYAGFIGSVTGMNEKQVAVGEMGGRGNDLWDGMPMPMLFRKVLEEADTLQQAVNIFKDTPRTCEYYYVISDGKIRDARGVYGTPDKFIVLKPGEKYDKLAHAVKKHKIPQAIDDAVVFSGGDRLTRLLGLIRKNYGAIDPPAAIRLMDRPGAMKGNLHNVLFAPQTLEMWVAHALGDHTKEKYQASFQEYLHYDLPSLLKLLPAGVPSAKAASPARTTAPGPHRPTEQTGRVPATVFRPMAPSTDPRLAELLKKFQHKPAAFPWRMKPLKSSGSMVVYNVEFPSPFVSPVKRNNTVHCEYFLAANPGRRPTVIVLHILDGSFTVARIICNRLAAEGTNALLVKMPYYGPRRPADKDKLRRKMTDNPESLVGGVIQAVMDVRRAARWLSIRPEVDPNNIGLCGVSLGGFVAATAGGVDGRFPRVAVILAGGDLIKVVTSGAKEVRSVRQAMEKRNWTQGQLKQLLAPIDPLTYAARLRSSKVLMINATRDKVVLPQCARSLAEASQARIIWCPADHYSMVMFLPAALEQIAGHFSTTHRSQ